VGRLVATATAFAVMALGLSACNSPAPHAHGKVLAVGAENQYANVISQIGGRYVQTAAIMSNPSTDPHTFEVSTSVAHTIASAQLVVQNGSWLRRLHESTGVSVANSSRDIIDAQTLLGLPLDTKNPHLWYTRRDDQGGGQDRKGSGEDRAPARELFRHAAAVPFTLRCCNLTRRSRNSDTAFRAPRSPPPNRLPTTC